MPGEIMPSNKSTEPEYITQYLAQNEPGEMSIEAPPYSPLTPRPIPIISTSTAGKEITKNGKSVSGFDDELNQNVYDDADDSVKDPDNNCDEEDDTSSNGSVSFVENLVNIHNLEAIHNSEDVEPSARNNNVNENVGQVRKTKNTEEEINDVRNNKSTEEDNIDNITTSPTDTSIEQGNTDFEQLPGSSSHIDKEESSGRPRKGRKRKFGGLTRVERKKRKYIILLTYFC